MMITNLRIAAVLAVTTIFPWSEASALVISMSDTAPTGPFVASQPTSEVDNGDSFRYRTDQNPANGRDIGQMFTTGSSNLLMSSFTLRVRGSQNITGQNVTVRFGEADLVTDNAGDAADDFNLTNATTVTANLPSTITDGDYITFDLDDTLLSANTTYAFFIGLTNVSDSVPASSRRELDFFRLNTSNSTNPRVFERFDISGTSRTNLTWDADADRELQFWVSVPEPSSIAILGLVGALGIFCRRRCS